MRKRKWHNRARGDGGAMYSHSPSPHRLMCIIQRSMVWCYPEGCLYRTRRVETRDPIGVAQAWAYQETYK